MWSLLNWLYDRASRVYEFFGSLYYSIKDAAINAWSWARNAFSSSISWAWGKINQAKVEIENWVNANILPLVAEALQKAKYFITIIGDWWDRTRSYVIEKYNELVGPILQRIKYWETILSAWWSDLRSYVIERFNELIGPILQRLKYIDTLIKEITGYTGWIRNPQVESLVTTLLPWQQGLIMILKNPLGWFAAYLRSIFLIFLEFGLGYALGAVNSSLPPFPDFGEDGYGGPIPGPPGPPPDASPLAPPLARLYVSGYYFRPGHPGLDFGCSGSEPVFACHNGKVKVAGWSTAGYGNYVIISNGEWWSLYAHLSQIGVYAGQQVSARETIAICGCTGNSTCNHLHLELKRYGQHIDPLLVFGLGG